MNHAKTNDGDAHQSDAEGDHAHVVADELGTDGRHQRAAEQHTDAPSQLVGGEFIGGGGQVDESEIQIDALIFAGHEQQCRSIGATATKHTKVSPSTTLRRCRKTPRTKQ